MQVLMIISWIGYTISRSDSACPKTIDFKIAYS